MWGSNIYNHTELIFRLGIYLSYVSLCHLLDSILVGGIMIMSVFSPYVATEWGVFLASWYVISLGIVVPILVHYFDKGMKYLDPKNKRTRLESDMFWFLIVLQFPLLVPAGFYCITALLTLSGPFISTEPIIFWMTFICFVLLFLIRIPTALLYFFIKNANIRKANTPPVGY